MKKLGREGGRKEAERKEEREGEGRKKREEEEERRGEERKKEGRWANGVTKSETKKLGTSNQEHIRTDS